jgi:hypothetical protein
MTNVITPVTAELIEQVQGYISIQQTFHMDAFDMEEITEMVYGNRIEMLESPNDTTHQFNVNGKSDDYNKRTLDNAIKNGHLECYSYGVILNDLCAKKIIKPGKYFLRMSW